MASLSVELVGKRWALPLTVLVGLSSLLTPVVLAEPLQGSLAQAEAMPGASDAMLQDDAYILGSGDGLSLKFLAVSDLSGSIDILNDGTASLPLLGSVRLSGLTLSQATLWLESLYRNQLQRPDLQLSVVRPRPLRVAVIGEVELPGLYTLTNSEGSLTQASVSISGLPTLVDAIQKAGGITSMANLRRVVVQRRLPGADSRFKRARVDLLALVRDGDQLQNPLLFDGDTIKLERVAQEDASNSAELAATTLAPKEITVNIIGEVKSPGRTQVPASTPLMQAIMVAGGVQTWRAKTSKLELVRLNRNGSVMRRTYPLDFNQGVSIAKNPPLVDGDTVIVNRSRYAISTDAIGAVSQPLSGLVNVLTLFRLLDSNNN
ncbi:SLBB domain-containing protein [Synechococcus sp. 1G10]|uniref:SLBB domain-containing protein n=1 Tax=Synechococcus sp. 1G10 TaxID=2025605 RepID=UPI000B99D45E|nr:SLBB domain-containing protein [Synechococcus sp. 1G10]